MGKRSGKNKIFPSDGNCVVASSAERGPMKSTIKWSTVVVFPDGGSRIGNHLRHKKEV